METVIRVAVVYGFLLVGLRLIGKRTFGQLSPADLVILLMIPEFLQQPVMGEDYSLTNGLVAVSTLLIIGFAIALISYRFRRIGEVIEGKPVTVISQAALRAGTLDHERLSSEEVLDAMHRAGLERMEQVKWAVLYPDGTVALVPWEAPQPAARQE